MTATFPDPIVSHQCRWGDCYDCPEPRRCEHDCHLVIQAPRLRLGGRLARRVWGRWT